MKDLILKKRNPAKKYQVRFWTQPDVYLKFKNKLKSNEIHLTDAFNDFMKWYLEKEPK